MAGLMRRVWILPLGLLLGPGAQGQSVPVPTGDGRHVMTDGILESAEWDDAHRIPIGEAALVYLKEHGGYVFIGVDCGDLGKPFVVDLFLTTGAGEVLQMHASAQIGERILGPEEEDPPWIWGHSPGWYANEVRWDQGLAQSLMDTGKTRNEAQREALFDYDGFEFQILRSKFPEGDWLMRVEVLSSPDYDSPLIYPSGTSLRDTDGWMRLSVSPEARLPSD